MSYDVICVILCLAVLVQCRLVIADRQTHDDSIYRASIAPRGKKPLNAAFGRSVSLESTSSNKHKIIIQDIIFQQ